MKIGLLPFYLELYDQVCPQYHDPAQRFADRMAEELRKRGFEVVSIPLCRVRAEFQAALKAMEDAGCEALATLHLAYSPSLESADLIAASPLPVVVMDTTPDALFSDANGDEIMANHGIHGVQDFCNLLLRLHKPFLISAGHWQNSDLLDRITRQLHAAGMAWKITHMRVGNAGGDFAGMGDFQIPEGTFNRIVVPWSDQAEPSAEEVEAERAADLKAFVPVPELDPEAHRRTLRASLKLRHWLEQEKLEAFTVCFPGITRSQGWETVPFLECSKAMARGLGYAGEGDILTAAVNRCLARVFPGTSFMEMFCPDWSGNRIFTSHMGEINTALCSDRPCLHEMPYRYSDTGNPVLATGCFKSGQALLTNLAPGPNNQFTLLAATVDFKAPSGGSTRKNSGWFTPHTTSIGDFLAAYSEAGGTHHLALSYDGNAGILRDWAKLMGWKFVIIR
ncbi:MAG: hypothetical protein WCT05_01610 [Lentisphaeria bacterium]